MQDAIATFVPLYGFMLIPVWIPLIAIFGGKVLDLVRPREEQSMAARLAERRAEQAEAALAPVLQLADSRHRDELADDEVAA